MVKTKYDLYIGSDNKTHKLSVGYVNKIESIISSFFDGFNIEYSTGFYKGTKEETIKIILFLDDSDSSKINNAIEILKQELKQESVLVHEQEANFNFI